MPQFKFDTKKNSKIENHDLRLHRNLTSFHLPINFFKILINIYF